MDGHGDDRLGRMSGLPFCEVPTDSGGRYDPSSDSWTPVSGSRRSERPMQHSAVWSGSEMIVFGGSSDGFECWATAPATTPAATPGLRSTRRRAERAPVPPGGLGQRAR